MEASGLKTRSKKWVGAEQERLIYGKEEKVTGGVTKHTNKHKLDLEHSVLYVPLVAYCGVRQ